MDIHGIPQYVTYKADMFPEKEAAAFCEKNALAGTGVFMDDIVPRNRPLFSGSEEKRDLTQRLEALRVRRLHCSYWAYPTSFLTKNDFNELTARFGGLEAVRNYYGDLTGERMFARWMQEYELACSLNAQSYTFHLIDYAPIDGAWAFTVSRSDIRQAMVFMAQQLLCRLEENGLLSPDSPRIELENAGWGLEYGTQTASDYKALFRQLHDPMGKMKIVWDVNHLLHAVGGREGAARFMLPEDELGEGMPELEAAYGGDPAAFAFKWLEANLLDPDLAGKVGAVELSDCALKSVEYFTRGKLNDPYAGELAALCSWEEKESYGVDIVLGHYDSHVPLGRGVLSGRDVNALLGRVAKKNPGLVLVHELKNSKTLQADLTIQLAAL